MPRMHGGAASRASRASSRREWVISPTVKLSPNARNLVRASCGAVALTTTLKRHDTPGSLRPTRCNEPRLSPLRTDSRTAACSSPSTGATPPVVVGGGNETVTGTPSGVDVVTLLGQVIDRGGRRHRVRRLGGWVGDVGELHPQSSTAVNTIDVPPQRQHQFARTDDFIRNRKATRRELVTAGRDQQPPGTRKKQAARR